MFCSEDSAERTRPRRLWGKLVGVSNLVANDVAKPGPNVIQTIQDQIAGFPGRMRGRPLVLKRFKPQRLGGLVNSARQWARSEQLRVLERKQFGSAPKT